MYSPASSLTGFQPIRAGWRDVLTAHGAVPDVGMILATYDQWCNTLNIDPNLALAQACHEATWFTSTRWTQEWNPAGLGVTSSTTPPNPFKTPQEGIEAHIEHLCAYTYTTATCPVDHAHMADRRHFMHEGFPDLAGLERSAHWAFPGTGYVDSIVSIANSIGGATVSAVPTEADLGYPGHVHYATGSGETMNLADVNWYVLHDTEGYFSGDETTLSGEISAHLLIAKTGEWRFMVPLTSVAYATGDINVNRLSINVEQSGFADAHDGGYTDAQYRCAAAFYRFCVAHGMVNVPAVYIGKRDGDAGPLPDVPGILGHQDVPRDDGKAGWGGDDAHHDPGPTYQWDRLIAYIGNAPPPSDGRFFPETGRTIKGNIKGFYEQFNDDAESLKWFGYPISDLEPGMCRDGQVRTVQWFQRARFEDWGGGDVRVSLLGSDTLLAQGRHGPGID